MGTTDEDTEQFVSERARQTASETPRRPFRVRPNHGGLGPEIDPGDPKALKDFLHELDDEHYFDVLRREGSGDS